MTIFQRYHYERADECGEAKKRTFWPDVIGKKLKADRQRFRAENIPRVGQLEYVFYRASIDSILTTPSPMCTRHYKKKYYLRDTKKYPHDSAQPATVTAGNLSDSQKVAWKAALAVAKDVEAEEADGL